MSIYILFSKTALYRRQERRTETVLTYPGKSVTRSMWYRCGDGRSVWRPVRTIKHRLAVHALHNRFFIQTEMGFFLCEFEGEMLFRVVVIVTENFSESLYKRKEKPDDRERPWAWLICWLKIRLHLSSLPYHFYIPSFFMSWRMAG